METGPEAGPARPGPSSRGVSRVLGKLKASIEAKNFYEAHQMYRTIYFRYTMQAKHAELLELLHDGALKMLQHEQYNSGADLCLLVVKTLEETMVEAPEMWMTRLAELISRIKPNVVERDGIMERTLKWSGTFVNSPTGHPMMHKQIAQILHREKNFSQARYHYTLSKDGNSCALLVIELSKQGFPSEIDLFIAQIVLQQLCMKERPTARETFLTYVKLHPAIAKIDPPYPMPLLNFLFLMLRIVEEKRQYRAYGALCNLYKSALERDASFDQYLQKIAQIYFNNAQQEQPRNVAFNDLIQQFLSDLDVLDDDDGSIHGEVD